MIKNSWFLSAERIQGPTQRAVELLQWWWVPPPPPSPPHTTPWCWVSPPLWWFSWTEAVGPCRWILCSTIHARATCCRSSTHTDLTLSSFDLVLFFARLSPEVPIVPEIRHGEYTSPLTDSALHFQQRSCETFQEYPREDISYQAVCVVLWLWICQDKKKCGVQSDLGHWRTTVCVPGVVSIFAAFLQSYFPHHHKESSPAREKCLSCLPTFALVKQGKDRGNGRRGCVSECGRGGDSTLAFSQNRSLTPQTAVPAQLQATGKFQFIFRSPTSFSNL